MELKEFTNKIMSEAKEYGFEIENLDIVEYPKKIECLFFVNSFGDDYKNCKWEEPNMKWTLEEFQNKEAFTLLYESNKHLYFAPKSGVRHIYRIEK